MMAQSYPAWSAVDATNQALMHAIRARAAIQPPSLPDHLLGAKTAAALGVAALLARAMGARNTDISSFGSALLKAFEHAQQVRNRNALADSKQKQQDAKAAIDEARAAHHDALARRQEALRLYLHQQTKNASPKASPLVSKARNASQIRDARKATHVKGEAWLQRLLPPQK